MIDDYMVDETGGRKSIMSQGGVQGHLHATTDYPYAVLQGQSLTQHAERTFQSWSNKLIEDILSLINNPVATSYRHDNYDPYIKRWNANIDEARRLYVSVFIADYMKKVAEEVEKDRKAGKQPPFIPATSPTGAQVKVIRIERDDNEYRYYIELSDPGYIDGVLELDEPLYYPLNEAVASSGFAIAASDAIPSYQSSYTSQQTKNEGLKGGRRLHLKKR